MNSSTNDSDRPPPPASYDGPTLGERLEWTTSEYAQTFGLTAELALDRLLAVNRVRGDGYATFKRGGRWWVSVGTIRRTHPDDWTEVVARLRAFDDQRRAQKAARKTRD